MALRRRFRARPVISVPAADVAQEVTLSPFEWRSAQAASESKGSSVKYINSRAVATGIGWSTEERTYEVVSAFSTRQVTLTLKTLLLLAPTLDGRLRVHARPEISFYTRMLPSLPEEVQHPTFFGLESIGFGLVRLYHGATTLAEPWDRASYPLLAHLLGRLRGRFARYSWRFPVFEVPKEPSQCLNLAGCEKLENSPLWDRFRPVDGKLIARLRESVATLPHSIGHNDLSSCKTHVNLQTSRIRVEAWHGLRFSPVATELGSLAADALVCSHADNNFERELIREYASGLRVEGFSTTRDSIWQGYRLGCLAMLFRRRKTALRTLVPNRPYHDASDGHLALVKDTEVDEPSDKFSG